MFRTGLKLSCYRLTKIPQHHNPRLYLAIRNYADKFNPPKSKSGTGFKYTVGTFTVLTVGTIGAACYDKDFRRLLGNNVPYSEEFIKVLLQEEKTYLEQLQTAYNAVQSTVYNTIFPPVKEKETEKVKEKVTIKEKDVKPEVKKISEEPAQKKEFKPPPPVFCDIEEELEGPEVAWKEIRVLPKAGTDTRIVAEIDKPPSKEKDLAKLPESHPKNLADLESKIATSAVTAVSAYNDAANAIRDYNKNISVIIDRSIQELDPEVWRQVKNLIAKKNDTITKAEKSAKEAEVNIEKMKRIIAGGIDNVSSEVLTKAMRNIERITSTITDAKCELQEAREKGGITERYWQKVLDSRKHFEDELRILFPGIDITEKKLRLDESEIDLFILHAVSKVLLYQKELSRLETISADRIDRATRQAGSGDECEVNLIKAAVQAQLDKDRRALELEFQKRVLQVRTEGETEVRQQLKRQAQAHSDHLAEVAAIKEQEVEREISKKYEDKLAQEQAAYKMQLGAMLGRLRGMDDALRTRAESDKSARQAHMLWSACQALHRKLKNNSTGIPWQKQLSPLKSEVENIRSSASSEDEFVNVVVAGIPSEATERGVYTEEALRERFLKVERVASRVALVPKDGGSLLLFLLSYIQSMLLIKAVNPIPAAETSDELVEVEKLDTFDILQRARYWLDRGDFLMTLRYMNLLQGASRCVAEDWINETRILLETQQAANALMAHAVAAGLPYV